MPGKTVATVAVRLGAGVREAIYDHVYANLEGEVGGVLVGYYPDAGARATISAVIPALRATGARASVTFTHEAWQEIHRQLDEYPGQRIVGWYHSHPGFGIFLSEHDLFIHRNFFSGPRQIAFVVDPYVAKEGWFGWLDGKVLPISRETDAQRPARRPQATPPARDVRIEPRGRMGWPGLTACALLGLFLGVSLWFGLLRPDAAINTTPSRSATTVGRSTGPVRHAHPRVVEPQAGAVQPSFQPQPPTSRGGGR